jgi:3' terminal RNA ribose 2'-O-methyltransferase Hen1
MRILHYEDLADRQRERIHLQHGSLMYRDVDWEGFDAAALVEVIEHLDEARLLAMEKVVFACAKPKHVIVTTPNSEYNVKFPTLPAGKMRHGDHRFEWSREEFRQWGDRVADEHGYEVEYEQLGEVDPDLGGPSQMAVFSR